MPIEYKSHTADIQMVLTAGTLEELFSLALKGMSNIIQEAGCSEAEYKMNPEIIDLEGADLTNLLIDFLSDALSYTYINKTLYCGFHNIHISENSLICKIYGCPLRQMDEEIKAVTYHGARVCKNENDEWTVSIIFDI